jgi:hypothetical protein
MVNQRTRSSVKFVATLLFSVAIFAMLGIATVLLVCSLFFCSTVERLYME